MTDSEDDMFANEASGTPAPPPGVGPQLRAAREKKGLTLDQMAAETRISRRNLEMIEAGDFHALASRTYAVGFAKTYAKVVALDQEDVAAMVRAEMDEAASEDAYSPAQRRTFEPGDPARSPGGGLLWFSVFAIIVLLVGIFFAARALFSPAAEMPSLIEQQEQEEAAAQAAAEVADTEAATPIDPAGAVVFTAQGETWVRFYQADGRVLQEGTMRQGDSFTVPADAVAPQIITGRPDLLAITVGGTPVRKLSNTIETLQDVDISAEALLARPSGGDVIGFRLGTGGPVVAQEAPAAAATAAPAPRPTAGAAPTPTASATTPRPSPTASASTAPTPEPSPAATAPPRAEPAEPAEDPVSPPV